MYSSSVDDSFATRPETEAEIVLYDYVRRLAKKPSSEAIEDFYRLLFQGNTYPDEEARQALQQILSDPSLGDSTLYVINRCFYTIGNRWRLDPDRHNALRQLILRAEEIPTRVPADRVTRQLLKYVQQYVASDTLYPPLKRQMYLLPNTQLTDGTLAANFKDYFFIHEASTVTRDIPVSYRSSIRQQRRQQALRLNQQLNQYWQAHASGQHASGQPVPNPTRLGHEQLLQVIQTFHPDQTNSYQSRADDFDRQLTQVHTMGEFRDRLHRYIMQPLVAADKRYANNRFSHIVKAALSDIESESVLINPTSIVHTCVRLLKLLVCNTVEHPEVSNFKYLIEHVGHTAVTAVLLKIVLFRRSLQPWFEDRFGILFHHWEKVKTEFIPWLVDSFEYMNVALALNLSGTNYCG